MDNMLEHPGIELQLLIKEKGLTQKAFSSILGKKVSEVNELLKGKRNITIQRDYLLHQTLGTPIKYWILKQIDYDYSLIDIEETPQNNKGSTNNNPGSALMTDQDGNNEQNKNEVEPGLNGEEDTQDFHPAESNKLNSEGQEENKDNEDLKNRAKIFRTF